MGESSAQALRKSLLASCFLMSHWPGKSCGQAPTPGAETGHLSMGTVLESGCRGAGLQEQEDFVAIFPVCHLDPELILITTDTESLN